MPTITPNGGINEREPTLIGDNQLQDTDGAEYRVGQIGLFVARGRSHYATISGTTGKGLYELGFDGNSQYVMAHEGNSLHTAPIVPGDRAFSLVANLAEASLPIVGAHYGGRHYLATNVQNVKVEHGASGVTTLPIGMSTTRMVVGASVLQGSGSITATTGLEYWVTEYDSARGIESVLGASTNTGAFSLKNGIVLTVTGQSANATTDKLRWYRSTDGGGYPDGGLIRETAIGTTQITDTNSITGSLATVQYGIISIGGLDTDRDEMPPIFSTIFGPFQDSMLGVSVDEPRVLRFTPAGYPDSWPSGYGIPLDTSRRDQIVTGVVVGGRVGVMCNDSVHVIYRLPRDSDSIFAAGEAQEVVTTSRGCMSRRGAAVFTPPGGGSLVAWVARDGIWLTNLATAPAPLTDNIDWEGRVSLNDLSSCRLVDDPINRRLIFLHRKMSDTTYSTGVWYLDYQNLQDHGIRITFADHGPLADAVTVAGSDGARRAMSIDSRPGNGKVYTEAGQDVDASQLRDSSGSVHFRMRLKEFLPGGANGSVALGNATWMHDAGPAKILHRFFFNRRDSNPEVKEMPNPTIRNASDVVLGRNANSVYLEIESFGTQSYGVHWVDIEGVDVGPLGGVEGA